MDTDLTGKTALVTGASRGLGREVALHLARAGANVALLARDAAALEETRLLLTSSTSQPQQRFAIGVVDLQDLNSFPEVLRALSTELPAFDILVNNAAVQGPIGSFEEQEPHAWRAVMSVNFHAAAEFCRLLLPGMKERRYGKIISISGGGATGPRADFSAYAASKAALVRFSETLAVEIKPWQIDVNCVAPGAMNTRMLDELLAAGPHAAAREYTRAEMQAREGGTSLGKGAELVHFLASPQSDGLTGRLLSAVWDDWRSLPARRAELEGSDLFTLRRIAPHDRGLEW